MNYRPVLAERRWYIIVTELSLSSYFVVKVKNLLERSNFLNRLAILGGTPVRQKAWPRWPMTDEKINEYLIDVAHSGRWGMGGKFNGTPLYNLRFEDAFAKFHNALYCVTVANGSAALAIALEALGVGFGDEVIIPGLSWISCATAVTRIGAIPILVDVEPETLCISVESVQKAITEHTKAIMVVHSYCTVADVDGLVRLSEETGIPLVEDCSQAHGAEWKKQRVGTFGKIGVFSMGNSKVLSCGEGGAIISNDSALYNILQQLRGDGYQYKKAAPIIGESQIEEVGTVQGYNYCLSEFQAAILLGGLTRLDQQNELREKNGEYFRQLCSQIGDVTLLVRRPNINRLTYFRLCVRINLDAFGGASIQQIRKALVAELNEATLEPVDHPLNSYTLYKPLKSPIVRAFPSIWERFDPTRFSLPITCQAYKECLTFHHLMLLGNSNDIDDIANAFLKLKENGEILKRIEL